MKKIIFLLLIISLNFSCSRKLKSIDRKVTKIDKQFNKEKLDGMKTFDINVLDSDHNFIRVHVFENKNTLKKITFEVLGKNNFEEFNRQSQIYLENNVPIFITETAKGKQIIPVTGFNKTTKQYLSSVDYEFSVNDKAYIENWEKFEVNVLSGSNTDFILEHKGQYRKIITKVLEVTKIK